MCCLQIGGHGAATLHHGRRPRREPHRTPCAAWGQRVPASWAGAAHKRKAVSRHLRRQNTTARPGMSRSARKRADHAFASITQVVPESLTPVFAIVRDVSESGVGVTAMQPLKVLVDFFDEMLRQSSRAKGMRTDQAGIGLIHEHRRTDSLATESTLCTGIQIAVSMRHKGGASISSDCFR